jgi:hypothetical protein
LTAAQVRELYPQLGKFLAICRQADPAGAFQSEWTRRMFDA